METTPNVQRHYKPSSIAEGSNIPFLGRTRSIAHLQSARVSLAQAPSTFPKLSRFFNKSPEWIWCYVSTIFSRRHKYQKYLLDGSDGVYPLHAKDNGDVIKISIAGDWGTGTAEAAEVKEQMQNFGPDYTIHLGDVYYMGDGPEVEENFLGKSVPQSTYTPIAFPTGSVGTFALMGNHEMFVGGKPYFTEIIGPNGFCNTGSGGKQKAAFFSLETPHWRILGIDTGYNSVGIPFLGTFPIIKKIPWVGADCVLEDDLLNWLRINVKPQENKKPTLLLSHHQYYSVYEEAYERPAEQLKEFFSGQDLVWIWGHEHRLSIYDNHAPNENSIKCYGRCLGHGGMPVPPEAKGKTYPLLFLDPRGQDPPPEGDDRRYRISKKSYAGWNGFLNITLAGDSMTLDYRDVEDKLLLKESFVESPGGSILYQLLENHILVPPGTLQ